MPCIKPFRRVFSSGKISYVPCGDCLLCREKRSMELMYYSTCEQMSQMKRGLQTTFVTLTYSDDNQPLSWCAGDDDWRISPAKDVPFDHLFQRPVPSLCHKDFVDFNKRFRYYVSKYYGRNYPYKFLCAGEYGDLCSRPHFHYIAYGLSPAQVERCAYPAWNKRGHIDISPLGCAGTNYLVGYCSSLPTRNACKVMFDDAHRERPFLHHSKFLGSDVLCSHISDYLSHNSIPRFQGTGNEQLPAYYRRKYGKTFNSHKFYASKKRYLESLGMTESQWLYMRYQSALDRVRSKGIASYDESSTDYINQFSKVKSRFTPAQLAIESSYDDEIPF